MIGVEPDALALLGRQRPRLLPDPERDRNAADVVHERAGAALGTPPRPGRARFAAAAARSATPASARSGTATRGPRSHPSRPARRRSPCPRACARAGLACEAAPMRRRRGERGSRRRRRRGSRDRRIEAAPARARTTGRVRGAAALALRISIARDVAMRSGSGISSPRARPGMPLPSHRSCRREQSADADGKPSRTVSIRATSQLAAAIPGNRARPRQGARSGGAHRSARPGDTPRERAQRLAPRPNSTGSRLLDSTSAPSPKVRPHVHVGRAADVEQQAGVVRLRRLGGPTPRRSEPERESVLRSPCSSSTRGEVGGERQRRDHLRGPHSTRSDSCLGRHAP